MNDLPIIWHNVLLLHSDGTTWYAGAFPSLEAANAWITEEKTRPYWSQDTQVIIEGV